LKTVAPVACFFAGWILATVLGTEDRAISNLPDHCSCLSLFIRKSLEVSFPIEYSLP